MAGRFARRTAEQAAFLAELIDRGLLVETGVPGVYGRGADFERRSRRRSTRCAPRAVGAGRRPSALRFPPLLPRRQLETNGYLTSFPHLAGTVFAFEGNEAEAARAGGARPPATRTGASSSDDGPRR